MLSLVMHGAFMLLFVPNPGALAADFLAASPKLQVETVRGELHGVLSDLLGHGHGVNEEQLARIRSVIAPIFRALPKSREDRTSSAIVRYVVQRYFSQRRGWIMKGFEPHAVADNSSDLKDGSQILEDKVPNFIRTVLEQTLSHGGFALEDAAVMIAALERLVLDEVNRVVELSYEYNYHNTTQGLDHDSFLSVLSSYLIVEMTASRSEDTTLEKHMAAKLDIRRMYPHWDETFVFLSDIAENDGFLHTSIRNPFLEDSFFFEDAVRVSQAVSEEFGPYSNHECDVMKLALSVADPQGTGRVKITDFYDKTKSNGWQFDESVEYLRQVGAIDESSSFLGPQVIIANYIAGMNNCITSTPYYSICCLNECDGVYQQLETVIPSAYASSTEISNVVEAMLQETEGTNLSWALRTRLEDVAALHDGKVPVHGRLLAQWLHFVFPRDCPYPHMAGTTNPQHRTTFETNLGEGAAGVTAEEVEQFLQGESARVAPSPEAGALMWNLHEVVLDSGKSDGAVPSVNGSVLRMMMLLVMIATFAGFLLGQARGLALVVQPRTKAFEHLV